jgi:hypothetical protein
MNRGRSSAAVLIVFLSFIFSVALASANAHGYEIWFAAKILSVDERAGRIRIARGPTETAVAAVIDCRIARRAVRRVYPGMLVDIQADTRSEPWRIIHLRPLELKLHHRSHPTFMSAFLRTNQASQTF